MAPHIVRSYAEEETGLNTVLVEQLQQLRHPFPGTAEGIYINSQTDFLHSPLPS